MSRRLTYTCLIAFCVAGGSGCSNSPDASQKTAGDRALADPWNYGPKGVQPDTQPRKDDSSFDRDGLKRDLNHVLNP